MTEEQFDELRRSTFAIAYRMLGSVSEAEDVVQEGFLRLHRAREGGERIEPPRAYLSTVVSRLSLDHLRREGRKVRAPLLGDTACPHDELVWKGMPCEQPGGRVESGLCLRIVIRGTRTFWWWSLR
jgi:DNA-directed RNA polymerase specialized sigma24 family protein